LSSDETPKEKVEVHPELLLSIVEHLSIAPETQCSAQSLKEVMDAKASGFETKSAAELFDIIQGVTKFYRSCQISSFIYVLCDLEKFYKRP
jgi:hypothetical protein